MQDKLFRDVSIFPSHARRAAIVAWIVSPVIADAKFYVYRKLDGGAEWERLNDEPVYGTTFVDTSFYIPNKVQVPCYKVVAVDGDGKVHMSHEQAMFDRTGRKTYGVAHYIIRTKYYKARQDGIPVLYYPAVKNGRMSSSLDDLTGQRLKAGCSSTGDSADPDAGEDDDNDYGMYYAKGFYRPFITYIRFIGQKLQRQDRLDDGIFDASVQNVEFLAFPPVRTGDMVVDVPTDRRWLVGSSIKEENVRGIVPVGYVSTLSLQDTNDPVYGVPVPTNYHYMIRRLSWGADL